MYSCSINYDITESLHEYSYSRLGSLHQLEQPDQVAQLKVSNSAQTTCAARCNTQIVTKWFLEVRGIKSSREPKAIVLSFRGEFVRASSIQCNTIEIYDRHELVQR